MERNTGPDRRTSKTDSFMSLPINSMSQDFLGSKSVLGGTFDDLDEFDGKYSVDNTMEPTLVGQKHLRSLSFVDSRDMGENDNDIYILNTNMNGPQEVESGLSTQMSPPHGVPFQQKKSLRSNLPSSSISSSRTQGDGHRKSKSLSSASADHQAMMDCFRRDPNPPLNDLLDFGSMSVGGSTDIMRFTSEDWRDAFIQISDSDIAASSHPGMELVGNGIASSPRNHGQRRRSSGDSLNSVILEQQSKPTSQLSSPSDIDIVTQANQYINLALQPVINAPTSMPNERWKLPVESEHEKKQTSSTDFRLPQSDLSNVASLNSLDMNKKAPNRGKYRCGRCGQPKVNHSCPYEMASAISVSVQTHSTVYHESSHPFATENTIIVGRRSITETKSMISCSKDNNEITTISPSLKVETENSSNEVREKIPSPSPNIPVKDMQTTHIRISSTSPSMLENPPPLVGNVHPRDKFQRSGSNDTVYSEILKDIRIVHPSLQSPTQDDHDTTDDSEAHSLFLSSFSSHSASTDQDH